MTRITDAVRTANRIMRKYDERNPERIAHYAGIMILPQPFVKQKGAYTVMMRKPIIFIKRDLHPAMRSIVLAHELGHHFLHRQEAMQSGGFHEFNLFDMPISVCGTSKRPPKTVGHTMSCFIRSKAVCMNAKSLPEKLQILKIGWLRRKVSLPCRL